MKKINSTDLHIQYRNETGDSHQWKNVKNKTINSTNSYSIDYAHWLEEKCVELINEEKKLQEIIMKFENALYDMETEFHIDNLEDNYNNKFNN